MAECSCQIVRCCHKLYIYWRNIVQRAQGKPRKLKKCIDIYKILQNTIGYHYAKIHHVVVLRKCIKEFRFGTSLLVSERQYHAFHPFLYENSSDFLFYSAKEGVIFEFQTAPHHEMHKKDKLELSYNAKSASI